MLIARKAALKDALVEHTKKHHSEFLKTLSPAEQARDYEAIGAWNVDFEVHKVPSIEEAVIPVHPLALSRVQVAGNSESYFEIEDDDFSHPYFSPPEYQNYYNELSQQIFSKVIS